MSNTRVARAILAAISLFAVSAGQVGASRAAEPDAEPADETETTAPATEADGATTWQWGAWSFEPLVDLRIRSEYRRNPYDSGGARYAERAVWSDGPADVSPVVVGRSGAVQDQLFVAERARIGIAAQYEVLRAVFTLQDARAAGATADIVGSSDRTLPSTAPFEGYVELATTDPSSAGLNLRVGRQVVVWGDGRLLGESDQSPLAQSLDAVRGQASIGDLDVEVLAAMLALPGALPPEVTDDATSEEEGNGAQLYGLRAAYHFAPLLHAEAAALMRFARAPLPGSLTPSDTYVVDGRLFGSQRGFSYSLEGAYQLGRQASFGENRDVSALALAGRIEWETALVWNLTFGAQGAYASGSGAETSPADQQRRFDPILPEQYDNHTQMGLTAWSNMIEAGGDVAARPLRDLEGRVAYRLAMLAEADGRWTGADLTPIGSDVDNDSSLLGHVVEMKWGYRPWEPFEVGAAYGLFILGDGAKNILNNALREPSDLSHWAMLETRLRLP